MKIKRSIFNKLASNLFKPGIFILLGARQVGKSTLMEDLIKLAKKKRYPYKTFNLELPDDLLFFSRSESELFNKLTKNSNTILFIDEFHYLKNASKLFKGIYDLKKNIKIVASGSSSIEIHKHLKESLAGRRNLFKVYPLCWEEWHQTKRSLDEFIVYGGLPGLIHLNNKTEKIEYLYQMIQTYLLKDAKGLIKEENIRALNHILFFLAENQGQIIPTSNLAREVRLTSRTIEKYLEILEQTFVVYGLNSFSGNLSNELKKSKKYYFYDNGIRNCLLKNFTTLDKRIDKGFLLESHAFLEFHKKLRPNVDLRFWRTKQGEEIDFIWIEDTQPIPIEIKSNFSGKTIPKHLLKFLKTYPNSPYGVILNKKTSVDIKNGEFLIKIRRFEECQEIYNDLN